MIQKFFSLALILAVVLTPSYARAQQNSSPADKQQTTDTALREKAFTVLESAADQISNLQSAENRARLGANIADSLWEHDEKRARTLFALVQDDIKASLAQRPEVERDWQTLKVFVKLRVDTVERIAKHDAKLALEFLRATKESADATQTYVGSESEQGLELRLAQQMVTTDPDMAVELALKALDEDRFPDELLKILSQLNKKHKEQALTLYEEIVHKLRDEDFVNHWQTQHFARNLVYAFKPPTTDNAAFRELIGFFVTQALANGCGNKGTVEDNKADFCRSVATVLPQMERIDPRAVQLKKWIPPDENVNVPPEAVYEFFDATQQEASMEDLLTLATKYPQVATDIYTFAARKASDSHNFEEARKLANRLVTDPEKKQNLLRQIDNAEQSYNVDEKRLAAIQSSINEAPRGVDQINLLMSYVDQFEHNRDASVKLLKQATDIAEGIHPGKLKTELQLRLAIRYCSVKSERGFVLMESLMPKLNELVEAAVKLDGYETQYVRDGEWNMSADGPIGALLTLLSQNAGYFAWCDFDRGLSVAAQFDRNEIRLMAHVKLAQAILGGPTGVKRFKFGYIY